MRQLLSLATQQHYRSWVLHMEILNATFYKLLENRPLVYFQATCRMYHAIFHAQLAQMIMLPCHQQQKLPCVRSA